MSISVKNIAFSIAGTTSKQFNIELDGAKYSLDTFKMTQRLLEPCKLEFKLRKAPEEDINEVQFTTCGSIIGKEVKLTLQTDSMEQEIQGFSENTQNADIEFEGWVTSAKGIRKETEYVIKVVAETKEVILKDSPDDMYFNEMKLESIVKFVATNRGEIEVEGNPKTQDPIFYTAQYRETSYQFLQRLAQRYGEWMFNNGKKFHFGKFNKQENITLAYPSKDLEYYSANLQTYRVSNHLIMPQGYNDMNNMIDGGYDDDTVNLGSRLNDIPYHAWQEKTNYWTTGTATGQGIEQDDKVKITRSNEKMDYDFFNDEYISYVFGRRANMLVYEGKSFCSKLEIGAKLTIKDNYISSESSQQKSEVQQDEILITEVIHSFNADELYENRFKGIATEADYPPYLDPTIYPVCNHPLRAVVKDNEDPKHWGRIRVRFQGPSSKIAVVIGKADEGKDIYEDPRSWTPWLKVVQPYSGHSADFNDPKKIYGTHWLPELGSYVLVDFEGGNFERPYVCGALVAPGFAPDDPKWYIGNNNVKAARVKAKVTDLTAKDNVIYVEPLTIEKGTTQATLSFRMKNSAAIRGFQFDLYLPDGVTAMKNNKGRIQASLSAGRLPEDDEHTLTMQEQADEAIRFLCGSQYDETFTGNEGEIVTLEVNIAEDMAAGNYPIILRNMRLSETDISKFYDSNNVETMLTVKGEEPQEEWHDGDIFTAKTIEGVDMTFQIISAKDRTCGVGLIINDEGEELAIEKLYNGKITIPSEVNGFNVKRIHNRAFYDCSITSVSIPDGVLEIGEHVFYSCRNLMSISIPSSVTTIGSFAFAYCDSLESITLPSNLINFGWGAVQGCLILKSIRIPQSVTNLEGGQFIGCFALDTVIVEWKTPIKLDNFLFIDDDQDITLYVPKGTKALYEAAEYWKDFKEIIEYEGVGIDGISQSDKSIVPLYNLSGQRVTHPRKGIYIKNGRKVLVK